MTSEAPPMPAAKPNPARRIGGVIASPTETLRDIAERPDWLVPLLIIVVASLLLGFAMSGKVDFETATREQLERRGVTGPELERQLEMISKVQRLTTPFFTALGGIIVPLVVALALMLAGRIFGGEATFKQSFSIASYAWIPQALKTLIMAALLMRAGEVDLMQLPLLLKSNLGFLSDPVSSPGVFTLLSSLDVFAIWTIVLLGIGFAYAHRLSRSVATALAGALFVVVVLIQAGLASVFGGAS
jgi:membrane protein, antimicrobial resistance system